MKERDDTIWLAPDLFENEDRGGMLPTVEHAESVVEAEESDNTCGEDFYINSSGLTPVQELARVLGLADGD
ncbi:MAG: hypothetical protein ACYTA5_07895 [Planctomycetota bacterium]|jgi:hypothetical protein